jgi:predicted metal-dependent hydrolase
VLQAILQVAVAHLHLERGNRRGATVLLGEGLGRLQGAGDACFGLDLNLLRQRSRDRLLALQQEKDPDALALPVLSPAP